MALGFLLVLKAHKEFDKILFLHSVKQFSKNGTGSGTQLINRSQNSKCESKRFKDVNNIYEIKKNEKVQVRLEVPLASSAVLAHRTQTLGLDI